MSQLSLPTPLSRRWRIFLFVAALAGAALRLAFVQDMEFKEDEHYNFIQTQLIGRVDPWPWVGMPSGAFLPNPGLSIWVFVGLARIVGATDPTQLAHALQIFSWLGILLILPFALRMIDGIRERREPWLWALALAMVNPFAVYYQRKLWPEPFLPFFSMLFLMGWWRRDRGWGAATWGLIGALLGQIHMSGFFLAGGFFLWTLFFEKKNPALEIRTRWQSWFWASLLGALPLIPWASHILHHGTGVPSSARLSGGWNEIQQLKFWVFWFSDPFGFHLGNPLGVLRGPSHWQQLSDFVRYPIWKGHPTYLNALAHMTVFILGMIALTRVLGRGWKLLSTPPGSLWRNFGRFETSTAFALSAALFGFGILLTLTGVMIRRYYLMVCFPLEFVWLAYVLSPPGRRGQRLLLLLWLAELIISLNLVGYVHVNEGAPQGDYGMAFHKIRENNLKATGKPWPDRPTF